MAQQMTEQIVRVLSIANSDEEFDDFAALNGHGYGDGREGDGDGGPRRNLVWAP